MNRGGRQGTMMELERRTQQIKEIVRVSAALRADMPPEAICALVAQTIHTALGFRAAVVNLIVPGMRHFVIAATAGISDAERQRLINDPPPVDHIVSLMHEDFLVSRSYFISHEHKYLLEGAGGIMLLTPSTLNAPRGPNSWHPDDVFFVPLISMRENRLLGFISLDLPEDGKVPTYETAEVVELLANQAATALDTARLFQQRNQERQALERGVADLLAHLERMRQRDLSTRAQVRASALNQVASALNDVSEIVGNALADVRDANTVVQQHTSEMRRVADRLLESAKRQSGQIRGVTEAIQHTTVEMHQIAERAADSSTIAEEAQSISNDGLEAAQQAGEGMNAVREITLQASKRMKRLGESSQEIGNIIQLVSEFASQTHLLALNAAIEAANAGEHGSGFALVAREIRNLAQNSNDATKQIQARIKGIQNETNQVAVTIEHATQQVVLLSDMVSRSGAALHTIAGVIQRVIGVVATMHQTAEEQANAAAAAAGTMASVGDIASATWASAEHISDSMDRLAELASTLQAKIERFHLSERLQAGGPVAILPTQPPAASPLGTTPPGDVSLPAASYPRVTFPMRPSTGAPARDPYATSRPPLNPGSGPAAPASADLEMLATMPMPAVQIPPAPRPLSPSTPLTQGAGETPAEPTPPPDAERVTAHLAVPAQQSSDSTPSGHMQVPTPPPLFPVSSSPLTPLRLSALDQDGPGGHDESSAGTADALQGDSGAHPAILAANAGATSGESQPVGDAAPAATLPAGAGDAASDHVDEPFPIAGDGESFASVTRKLPALDPIAAPPALSSESSSESALGLATEPDPDMMAALTGAPMPADAPIDAPAAMAEHEVASEGEAGGELPGA